MIKECKNCSRIYNTEKDLLVNTSRWRVCDEGHLWFNCSCDSTLFVPKNKHSIYAPNVRLSEQAKSLFNQISNLHKLPHIPSSVMTLLTLIQDPKAETKELAKKVKLEPFIATKVLMIAENIHAQRNPGDKPLDSIEHAIVYIGRKAIEEIITVASITAFPVRTKVFGLNNFWQEAQLTAFLAEGLAKRLAPELMADEVYLAGFLCNLGKVVQALCFPDKMDALCERALDPKHQLHWRRAEDELQMPSHCVLGEIGAAIWGLPTFVLEVNSRHHTDPNQIKSTHQVLIAVTTYANQIMHWMNYNLHRIDNDLLDACRKFFKLTEKEVDVLVTDLLPIKTR